jgi:hypothetical protein
LPGIVDEVGVMERDVLQVGVQVVGVNELDELEGSPDTANPVVWVVPEESVVEIVSDTLWPAVTAMLPELDREKSKEGGGGVVEPLQVKLP